MRKIFTFLLICSVSLMAFADLRQGALPGEFKVSPTKTVHFSSGNYQCGYNGNRFAEHQYDFLGGSNKRISSWYTSTSSYFDLLGWGQDYRAYKTDSATYVWFNDWGKNYISKADKDAQWRTLSNDEWMYLLFESGCSIGFATVNEKTGIILLPEGKTLTLDSLGIRFKSYKDTTKTWKLYAEGSHKYVQSTKTYFTDNKYSVEQWDTLEAVGAVFLPAACYRTTPSSDATDVTSVLYEYDGCGYYWTSTPNVIDEKYAYYMSFNVAYGTAKVRCGYEAKRYNGYSVRLVTENPTYNPVLQLDTMPLEANREAEITFTYGSPYASAVLLSLQATDTYNNDKQCYELHTTLEDAYVANLMDNILKGIGDFGSVFSGVSFFLPAGSGEIKLDMCTYGLQLSVHIGNSGVAHLTQNERGEAVVKYDIKEPTLVCIHASDLISANEAKRRVQQQTKDEEKKVELYKITIRPTSVTAIDNAQITNDQLPITNKVIVNGQLFILRDGKTFNVLGTEVR